MCTDTRQLYVEEEFRNTSFHYFCLRSRLCNAIISHNNMYTIEKKKKLKLRAANCRKLKRRLYIYMSITIRRTCRTFYRLTLTEGKGGIFGITTSSKIPGAGNR